MVTGISHVLLLVRDADEAIAFWRDRVGVPLLDDAPLPGGARWIALMPGTPEEVQIALCEGPRAGLADPGARADDRLRAGAWPVMTFRVDDCHATVEALRAKGVAIVSPAREEAWGVEAFFADPDGYVYSLVERRRHAT
jgi:catechol 2,3-dioxygenase-like lactoylglutathione lyase family enzyme